MYYKNNYINVIVTDLQNEEDVIKKKNNSNLYPKMRPIKNYNLSHKNSSNYTTFFFKQKRCPEGPK